MQAKAQHDADLELSKSGLTDQVTLMKSRVAMEQLQKRFELERARGDRPQAIRGSAVGGAAGAH